MIDYLTPGKIGALHLKNRVFIPAHATGLFDPTGQHTDNAKAYYSARIAGGAALVFLGETLVAKGGDTWSIPISQDKNISFYKILANLGGNASCAIFDQISAQGGQVWWKPGVSAYAPSSIPQPISGVRPDEMTLSDIAQMRNTFIKAASRTIDSGLHGCELKADQGKLIYQFLSRRYNRRTDIYGGIITNRVRFLVDILEEVRSISGSFCLGIRIPVESGYAQSDVYPDITFDEIIEIILILKQRRLIDYLNISSATNAWPHGYWNGHADMSVDTRASDSLVERIRNLSGLPVLYAGQFSSLSETSSLIQKGVCDFVGLARAHIADPEYTKKSLEGKVDQIRPCIRCNQGCVGNTWEGKGITCTVNPITGHELFYASVLNHSIQKRRTLVIGAGPSGMEFSLQAASLGWDVTLVDSFTDIGGRLLLAGKYVQNTDWPKLVGYYRVLLAKSLNIELRLGVTLDDSNCDWNQYDHIIFAGGRKSSVPEEFKVNGGPVVKIVDDAWSKVDKLFHKHLLIVDEDPYQGTLLFATKAACAGAYVTVITSQEYVGKGLDQVSLTSATAGLRSLNIVTRSFEEIATIHKSHAMLRCLCSGKLQSVPCDMLVLGIPPMKVNLPSLHSIAKMHIIGDARFPRGVEFALQDARNLLIAIIKQETIP